MIITSSWSSGGQQVTYKPAGWCFNLWRQNVPGRGVCVVNMFEKGETKYSLGTQGPDVPAGADEPPPTKQRCRAQVGVCLTCSHKQEASVSQIQYQGDINENMAPKVGKHFPKWDCGSVTVLSLPFKYLPCSNNDLTSQRSQGYGLHKPALIPAHASEGCRGKASLLITVKLMGSKLVH